VADVVIGHHPELTAARLLDIFEAGLGKKYQVYSSGAMLTDLMVKKSSWIGCGVTLFQDRHKTTLVTRPNFGNPVYAMLLGVLVATLVLRKQWRALEQEVITFIKEQPAFQ
jgi:hypothetical protein